MPTMWQDGVYSVMYYLNAIKGSGTDEPLMVAAKMRVNPIEDFFSRSGKLREDNLTVHDLPMVHDLMPVKVRKPEESKYPCCVAVIPGWSEGPDPESGAKHRRNSGFALTRAPE